jgi:hypothetical protein
VSVAADPGVGGAPADPTDEWEVTRRQVADRLGHDHPVVRRRHHPIEDPLGRRQEVVQAGLEDDHVGARQRLARA